MEIKQVEINLFGIYHDQLNMQTVGRIISGFESCLQTYNPENVTYVQEDAYGTPNSKAMQVKWRRENGFLLTEVGMAQIGDLQKVQKVTEAARILPFKDLIDSDLLPLGRLQRIAVSRDLDILKAKHPFKWDMETHPPLVASQNEKINGSITNAQQGIDEARKAGDLEGAISLIQSLVARIEERQPIRNRDISLWLKSETKRLLRRRSGGAFFLPLGLTHVKPIGEQVEAAFKYTREVRVVQAIPNPDDVDLRISNSLASGKVPDREDLLVKLASEAFRSEIRSLIMKTGNIYVYCSHYDDISKEADNVIAELKEEDYQHIWRNRYLVLDYFISHPKAPLINRLVKK